MTIKWTDIGGLHNVRKNLEIQAEYHKTTQPNVTYRGKIKLDGTNAGVRLTPIQKEGPDFYVQSRERDITPEDDNAGFARWCEDNRDYFTGLKIRDADDKTFLVFGEWCGQGIQKRCSISKIGRRIFAVFAIEIHTDEDEGTKALMIADPDIIREHLPDHPDIYIVPWLDGYEDVTIDFNDMKSLEGAKSTIDAVVKAVEKCDPWVLGTFGVDGLGEGVVYYPLVDGVVGGTATRNVVSRLMFKAKGDLHQVAKPKKPGIQISPEVLANIGTFVEMFVTENRLEQGVTAACGGEYDKKFTATFLKWLCSDVIKESKDELEASNLTWKQVRGPVQKAARTWYFTKVETF